MAIYRSIMDKFAQNIPSKGATTPVKKQTPLPEKRKDYSGGKTAIPTNTGAPRKTQPAHVAKITPPKTKKGYGKSNLGKTKRGFVD